MKHSISILPTFMGWLFAPIFRCVIEDDDFQTQVLAGVRKAASKADKAVEDVVAVKTQQQHCWRTLTRSTRAPRAHSRS
jgi:hypothetical protein